MIFLVNGFDMRKLFFSAYMSLALKFLGNYSIPSFSVPAVQFYYTFPAVYNTLFWSFPALRYRFCSYLGAVFADVYHLVLPFRSWPFKEESMRLRPHLSFWSIRTSICFFPQYTYSSFCHCQNIIKGGRHLLKINSHIDFVDFGIEHLN